MLFAEIFKDIPKYEGIYQASNFGRVKSLSRKTINGQRQTKEKILRTSNNSSNYPMVTLRKNNIRKGHTVSSLVAMTFLDYNPKNTKTLVCDHIDNNPQNNNLFNLQIITSRLNLSKDKKGSSKYTGVSWNKNSNKWTAQIGINGKKVYLGSFVNETDAANEYKIALLNLDFTLS